MNVTNIDFSPEFLETASEDVIIKITAFIQNLGEHIESGNAKLHSKTFTENGTAVSEYEFKI